MTIITAAKEIPSGEVRCDNGAELELDTKHN